MNTMRALLLLLLAITLSTTLPVQAQRSETISLQGQLTGTNGTPFSDGSHMLMLRLYDRERGGTALWTEAHTITTEDGLFDVLLGSINSLAALSFDADYYVELEINGETLTPRLPLASAPFAQRSRLLNAAALEAGDNVAISENRDGTLMISAERSGGSSISTNPTLGGDGSAGDPLRLSEDALVAGDGVQIAQTSSGAFRITATGNGDAGLTTVSHDLTLSGDGTSGDPLRVSIPVELTGEADFGIIRGENNNGNYGVFGTRLYGVYGEHGNGNRGWIGGADQGVYGQHVSNGHTGILGSSAVGASGAHANGNMGSLGTEPYGIFGQHNNGNFGWVGGSIVSVLGKHNNGNQGGIGEVGFGAAGQHGTSGNKGHLGGAAYGAYGEHGGTGNWGYFGGETYGVGGVHSSGNQGGLGNTSAAVVGIAASGSLAGQFLGDVNVTGNLTINGTCTGCGAGFKTDHPDDPANRTLRHAGVNSPERLNVYNGNIVTDRDGYAEVALPDYFEVLNRDFRYQLTVIGTFAQAIIAEEIDGNRFLIRTNQPSVKVSWQVTGIRRDAWAEANGITVEEAKPAAQQGLYLHPDAFGLPASRSYHYEAIQQVRDAFEEFHKDAP